ncbi:hypothetical protein PG996_002172 [Apiospora saccharicola]|uniref:Uncharacterized protein n=1 Tax=Apiospora saccharicola TaxID=335842 RepID=A0ABR1WLP9_9PEZI
MRLQEAISVLQTDLRTRPIVRVDDDRRRQEITADKGTRPGPGIVAAQRLLRDLEDDVDELNQLALDIAAVPVRVRLSLAVIVATLGLPLAVSTAHAGSLSAVDASLKRLLYLQEGSSGLWG